MTVTDRGIRKSPAIYDTLKQLCDVEAMNQRFVDLTNQTRASEQPAKSKTTRLITVLALGLFAAYSYRQGWFFMTGIAGGIAVAVIVRRDRTHTSSKPNYLELTVLFAKGTGELRTLHMAKSTWMCTHLNQPNAKWNATNVNELSDLYNKEGALSSALTGTDDDETSRSRYQSVARIVQKAASLDMTQFNQNNSLDPTFKEQFTKFHLEVVRFMYGKHLRTENTPYVQISTDTQAALPWPLPSL